jgi:hypothetical protein
MAVSGCDAGPLFNTVVGMSLSLALARDGEHAAPGPVRGACGRGGVQGVRSGLLQLR